MSPLPVSSVATSGLADILSGGWRGSGSFSCSSGIATGLSTGVPTNCSFSSLPAFYGVYGASNGRPAATSFFSFLDDTAGGSFFFANPGAGGSGSRSYTPTDAGGQTNSGSRNAGRTNVGRKSSFYMDCVQDFNCPILKNFLPSGIVKCPCLAVLHSFAERILLPSDSPLMAEGEGHCDPLSYIYEVGKRKWHKCCMDPKAHGSVGKPKAEAKRDTSGDDWTLFDPFAHLMGPLSKLMNDTRMDSSKMYCQEMDVADMKGDLVDGSDNSSFLSGGGRGNIDTNVLPEDALTCLRVKHAPDMWMDKDECVCWSDRKECIKLGKLGKKVPGKDHNYNVFWL